MELGTRTRYKKLTVNIKTDNLKIEKNISWKY